MPPSAAATTTTAAAAWGALQFTLTAAGCWLAGWLAGAQAAGGAGICGRWLLQLSAHVSASCSWACMCNWLAGWLVGWVLAGAAAAVCSRQLLLQLRVHHGAQAGQQGTQACQEVAIPPAPLSLEGVGKVHQAHADLGQTPRGKSRGEQHERGPEGGGGGWVGCTWLLPFPG